MEKNLFTFLRYLFILCILASCSPDTQAQKGHKIQKVVIDAGHGGKDPGALGKKSKEKNLTLAIALKLGKYIEDNVPGVTVEYTRTTDVFIDLNRRAQIANEKKADVFISIHINASKDKKVYGTSSFVHGSTRDAAALAVQKAENGAEDMSTEDIITFANVNSIYHGNSISLAGKIQSQFKNRAGRHDRGVKQANFAVLRRTNMPAVLVECGFITNINEEKYMMTDDGQAYLASAIYRAFKEYKREVEGTTEASPSGNTQTPPSGNTQTTPSTPSNDNKVYFRVQVKWSKTKIPLNSKEFNGLKVDEIKLDGLYKYTVGKTQDYSEIVKLQNKTREKIKDAFVIATKGNKRIDIKDAKKELGIK